MVDRTLYISGCIGFIPKTMEIVAGGAAAEANQALINMGAILKSVGCTHNNVVKTTVLLDDIKVKSAMMSFEKKYQMRCNNFSFLFFWCRISLM
jgi:2-iminobutanoate/2-iminopropanoate deaminase